MMFDSGPKEKYVRLADLESRTSSYTSEGSKMNRCGLNIEGLGLPANRQSKPLKRGVLKGSEGLKSRGWSLRFGGGVFAEDLRVSEKRIFDPQDKFLQTWNRLSLVSCILAVSIDPIFFYLPKEGENSCLGIDRRLATTTATIRTLIDAFYLFHMALQFRTAYVAPSSRVFGRGELVIEPTKIAKRYLGGRFFIDFLSVLPIPQIIVWTYLQSSHASTVPKMRDALFATVLIQYIPRFCRIIPLSTEMKRSSGVVAETAWLGAAYYLLCYILASHTVGAFWYYLSVQRVDACWDAACADSKNTTGCLKNFLYCGDGLPDNFEKWMINKRDILENHCNGSDDNSFFDFGIYKSAVSSGIITDGKFITKYCYCLWWGLKNLSTLGQGLETSTFPWEVIFSISLAILGLILFALLIGNMQTYLQSLMIRLEEMRVKRHDTEQWMHHRMLPSELKERVRRYDQYKWLETHGVDEESLVQSLPKDLRRDIKNHLCLALVRRVPLFNNMDERLLDAICERLKPSLYTENTYIVREGDPVDEMFLIIRGRLESETTDGGRSGFFNRSNLTEGDFCGEELLTWALDPKSGANLPSSTRTVRSITEVEGFALMAEELKFVASQFRRLHSRQVQHTFRFYSQQWRTWAACFIQAAWRRYSKRKLADQRRKEEESTLGKSGGGMNSNSSLGATIYVSRFAASALRGVHRLRNKGALELVKLQKPPEPDFSADID